MDKIFMNIILFYLVLILIPLRIYSKRFPKETNCLGKYCNSDPSIVTHIQISTGCSEIRPCIEIQWNSSQPFSDSDPTSYMLNYQITSPKSFIKKYPFQILTETSFRLNTHDKPGFGVTYEFRIAKLHKGKYGTPTIKSITLSESVPSDSPKELVVKEIDSRSALVSWKPLDQIHSNGIITHYEVRYYAPKMEESTERFLKVSETNTILSNLKYFHYVIYVRAFTKIGGGSWSNPINYYRQNLEEFPVPTTIKAERKSETEINISWELPVLSEKNLAYAAIEGFIILYSPVDKTPKWIKYTVQSKNLSAVIKGLESDLRYQFQIAATNYAGFNGNFSEIVQEMPKNFPNLNMKTVPDLRCSVWNSNRLKVEWSSPSITTDLLKFEIRYSGNLSYITEMGLKKSEFIDMKFKSVNFEKLVNRYDVNLDNLQSNALYKISVRAIYQNKELYESQRETTCATEPAVPDLVRPPTIIGLDEEKSKVIIKLYRCSQRNGKISDYFVIVAAFQENNNRYISHLQDTESYTFMELSINTRSNNVKGEYIAIMRDINEIFKDSGKDHSNVILGDGTHDENHLSANKKFQKDFNYRCFVRVCLKYSNNSLCKSSPWSQSFRLSDLVLNRNVSISSSKSSKVAYSNSSLIIIFLICGVILAIASIIIGCIVKRKKSKERFMHLGNHDDIRSSIGMKSSMLNGLMAADKLFVSTEVDEPPNSDKKYTSMSMKPDIKSIPDLVNADSVQMCQDGTKLSPVLVNDSIKLRIGSQKSENISDRPLIPICNLCQYVTDLKASDCTLLQAEFETLNTNLDDRFTWQRSNIDSNKSKNRYANVVAYDHTSVLLTPVDDVMGSDYINANYIDGYQRQNAYIATQGPLPDTTDDFWRMVWEQRSNCIVMMTRLEERSGIKCHQYWPNRGFICYGQMIVSHIDTFVLAYYTIRLFEIRHSKYSEKREIQHFQFTAWPDHGVPKLSTPLLMFIRRVRSIGKIESCPKIVHCSAGVGRTGAFIVVDAQLERIKQEKTIDVFNYVSKIRCQRNYMVQTQAQYQFILETLLEAVEDGNTEVMACNFHAHVTKLSQIGISGTNQLSGFEMEFSKLNSLASNRGRHGVMLADFVKAAGNQAVNMTKNRVRNIIPYEWNRVVLNAIRGIEGSDYINASYIDGYRDRRAYIAAQSPIPSTVEDFWRMLWDQHCGVVIVLNQPHEDKSHIYWPINKSIRYQFFVVDPVVEYNMPNYILREFKVTDARDGEFRALRQFQFTQWPTHGCPKESESILDFIRQVHKTKEQFGHMEPMVIHCNTGSGRTGVFIALSIVLDRLQQESVVDMYQTVKLLHKQRIGLVQTEEQYEFCYMAVLDYLSNYEKILEKSHLY